MRSHTRSVRRFWRYATGSWIGGILCQRTILKRANSVRWPDFWNENRGHLVTLVQRLCDDIKRLTCVCKFHSVSMDRRASRRSTSGRVASESANARVCKHSNICQTVTDRRAHAASYVRSFLSRDSLHTSFPRTGEHVRKFFYYLHVSVNACVKKRMNVKGRLCFSVISTTLLDPSAVAWRAPPKNSNYTSPRCGP